MSRIGRKPIPIPEKVKVTQAGGLVTVEGPKGKISQRFRPEARIEIREPDRTIVVERTGDSAFERAYHGTARALLANMVRGVSEGFQKTLEIVGVGYNAKLEENRIVLQIGFCHPVKVPVPGGIQVEIPQATRITVRSPDKQQVGEFAARIRRVRPPEPYKGKGIRYEGERIVKKAGKTFGTGA